MARIGPVSLLVADDDDAVRASLCAGLSRRGFVVHPARDGLDAMRRFMDHRAMIDAAVLDIHMPGISGIEVLEEIRRLAPRLPAVFVSGAARGTEVATLRGLGPAVSFLPKPFRLPALLAALKGLAPGSSRRPATRAQTR